MFAKMAYDKMDDFQLVLKSHFSKYFMEFDQENKLCLQTLKVVHHVLISHLGYTFLRSMDK